MKREHFAQNVNLRYTLKAKEVITGLMIFFVQLLSFVFKQYHHEVLCSYMLQWRCAETSMQEDAACFTAYIGTRVESVQSLWRPKPAVSIGLNGNMWWLPTHQPMGLGPTAIWWPALWAGSPSPHWPTLCTVPSTDHPPFNTTPQHQCPSVTNTPGNRTKVHSWS